MRCLLTATLLSLVGTAVPMRAQQAPPAQEQLEQTQLPQPPQIEQRPLRFHNLGLGDGLSLTTVFNVVQGEQGYIWFTT